MSLDFESRQAEQREDRVVAALVRFASRCGEVERATINPAKPRRDGGDGDDEAARIAHEHGLTEARVIPLRSLAASRNVPLETVLRAWLRGDLASIVRLPQVERRGS